MGKVIDLTGQKFHRLTVVSPVGLNKNNKMVWLCKCDCGNETNVISAHIKNGNTKSCGCLNLESLVKRSTKHGKKNTRLYRIRKSMKDRCYNQNARIYKHYGGKGITICEEWLQDFEVFYNWALSNGYEDNLTIDRVDFNGNYEPENCRWITIQEQQLNKCTTIFIELDGHTKTMMEWAELFNVPYTAVKSRYERGRRGYELFVPKQTNKYGYEKAIKEMSQNNA